MSDADLQKEISELREEKEQQKLRIQELEAKVATLETGDAPTTKQTVNPYDVAGEMGADGVVKAINYRALIEEFGTKLILEEDLKRFEKVTGHKPHRFLRRGIVFSHRDLNVILDRHEKGEPFYLYTGRGPSSDSVHIGHTIPFEFTKWLQDVFDVPLCIMLTDDEKYLFKQGISIEDVKGYTLGNAKDIIAVGFDLKKTFIFSDFQFMGGAFYEIATEFSKHITLNVAKAVFGFDGSANIGKIHFGAIQGATAVAATFPHIFGTDKEITRHIPSLIPCAIDQDPYFRVARDVTDRLHYAKPALLHTRFLDALQGPGSKMSASDDSSAIFMNDDMNKIKKKINKNAFSGGKVSEAEHRELGGDPDVDVSFQYLTFFLEDDEELERIRVAYKKGEMLTGELKAICISELQTYVKAFQERRVKVTDEVVKEFMATRKLEWKGNPNPIVTERIVPVVAEEEGEGSKTGALTKNAEKKLLKAKQVKEKLEAAKAAKAAKAAAASSAAASSSAAPPS